MRHLAKLLIPALAILWLGGCGQKGDLYKSADAPPPSLEESSQDKPKAAE